MRISFDEIESLINRLPIKIKNYFQYLDKNSYELDSDIKNETINFFKNNGVSLYPNGFSLNNYFEFFYQLEDNCFKLYDNNDICINSVKEIKFIFEKPSLIGQILLKLKNSFIYSDNVLVNIYSIKFELNNKKKDIILENIERVVNSSLSEIECYINKELVFIETENFEDDLYNEDQFEHDENIINALNNKNVEVNYLIENSLLIELLNNMYRINRKKRFLVYFKIAEFFTNKSNVKKGESRFIAYYSKKNESYKNLIVSNLSEKIEYGEILEYIRVLRNFLIHADEKCRKKYSKMKKFKLIDVLIFLEKLIEKEGNINLFV